MPGVNESRLKTPSRPRKLPCALLCIFSGSTMASSDEITKKISEGKIHGIYQSDELELAMPMEAKDGRPPLVHHV